MTERTGWPASLRLDVRLARYECRDFYGVIAAATLGGVILCFMPMNLVKELFWSAVLNGVTAVPIMAVMMFLASRTKTMRAHVIGRRLRWLRAIATTAIDVAVLAMLVTLRSQEEVQ